MRDYFNFYTIVFASILIFMVSVQKCDSRAASHTSNSTKQKFSIETNSIQRQIEEVYTGKSTGRSLKRVFLSNRTVTCNDGSQAGFYLRKSPGSKRWVVFLEGGWHCYDTKSCRTRWMKLRHLMTSAQWPEKRDVGGILSAQAAENPYWHNANHILVPYCSSDSWSGTKTKLDSTNAWKFMGSMIVKQVIADLIPLGLGRQSGSELLLAGSSAGGLGVMLNLDKINNYLVHEMNLRVLVRGVSDSGWFLDREPYSPTATVASTEAVRQGWKMWEGALPESCFKQYPNEPWRCYFGYRLYPTLKAPLFVFQWLFDEAQMKADNVGAPVTTQQWNYVHEMGVALRKSLDNVTGVFAPSCIGHAVLTKKDWVNIKIDDISLPETLRCWENATKRKHNKLRRASEELEMSTNRKRHKKNNHKNNNGEKKKLTKAEREERRLMKETRRKQRNENRRRRNQRNRNNNMLRHLNNGTNDGPKRRNKEQQQHQQQQRDRQHPKRHHQSHMKISEPEKCSVRLLERCSWPQCNHSCPTLTNPLTGEEIHFLELLTSFGLDIEAVATALGLDMQTLNNMDRTELVNRLTQAS